MVIIVTGNIMIYPILSKYNLTAQHKERNINYQEKFDDYDILHSHDYFELLIVLNGSYFHQLNNREKVIKKGNAYLLRPTDSHKLKSMTKSVAHANIMIKNNYFKKCCRDFSDSLLKMVLERKYIELSLSDVFINLLLNSLSKLNNTEDPLKIEFQQKIIMNNIFEEIVNNFNIVSETMPLWFKDILNTINKEENLKWTVVDVMNICNYSHTHMERLFKKYTNKTIIQYLTEIKMNYSANHLLYSKMKVQDISSSIGYSDVSHFNHVFKKIYGITPLQYKITKTKDTNYEF